METTLEYLESVMHLLCKARDHRIAAAEESIRRANVEFDRDAIPLARKINELREQAEADSTPTDKPIKRATRKRKHDPNWSQEDVDHWYELQQREAQNGK